MAVRKILLMGNPALQKVAHRVHDAQSPDIRSLVQDMRDSLEAVSGIGLAAPQIGVPLRVVLFCLPEGRIPTGSRTSPVPWTAMINPSIEPIGTEQEMLWERCLSVPGLYARVPRFKSIRISYETLDGKSVSRKMRGYLSALMQHECDHLDGILYPSKIKDMGEMAYASELSGNGIYRYSADEFDGGRAA